MELPSPAQVAVFALALGLGVGFELSLLAQIALQRRAIAGDTKASLFNRLTLAGLSMAILFGAVLSAKAFATVTGYENFMFASVFGAIVTFLARLRSNSTVKRDARKDGARPLP